MRLIKQIDDTGCGIACFAALVEIDYQTAKNVVSSVLKWSPQKRKFRTQPKQLIAVLNGYGVGAESDYFEDKKLLDGTHIIGVNCDGRGDFHWVISIGSGAGFVIYDPETAELYQGLPWLNVKDGYKIESLNKHFIKVNLKVTEVKI